MALIQQTFIVGFLDHNDHSGSRPYGLKMNVVKGWFMRLGIVFARDPMDNVLLMVSNCQTIVSSWNEKVFGNVRVMLTKKRKELE